MGRSVCNNLGMPSTDIHGASRVDLPLLWRASALLCVDLDAADRVTAEVAKANPRIESVRESTLVGSLIEAMSVVQERQGDGSGGGSFASLPLDENSASALGRAHAAMAPRSLALWVLGDVLHIDPAVLMNACGFESVGLELELENARGQVRAATDLDPEAFSGRLRDSILAFDPEPRLTRAREALAKSRSRRRAIGFVQFAIFAVIAGLLIYVKTDLKRAADKEHRQNAVPSLVEQFSNPLPEETSETP